MPGSPDGRRHNDHHEVPGGHRSEGYDFGIGTRRNFSKAMRYYARAARNGHKVAQYNLARGYLTGEGVRKSLRRGVSWLRRAARAGDAAAARDLGYHLHEGRGGAQESFAIR